MPVEKFEEIAAEFDALVREIVWCTFTTVDTAGRPFSRILHPIWEGPVGWVATGRRTLKTRHLARNPDVALGYWTPKHDTVMVQCRAEWCDDRATQRRIWDLLLSTPPPVGYDPALFWKGGVDDPTFGLLHLTPRRIEILTNLGSDQPTRVWQAPR